MTRPCYPWYCTECGSAINDRTNHVCKSKLTLTDAQFWQWRSHDGRKCTGSIYSDHPHKAREPESHAQHVERWLQQTITNHSRFMSSVQKYPHHRRRFAYAIRIYAKPQGEE